MPGAPRRQQKKVRAFDPAEKSPERQSAMGVRLAPAGSVRTSPLSQSEEADMPVLPARPRTPRRRGKSLTVRLTPEVEETLRARIEESGLRQSQAVALLLEFALMLEAEIRDLEPELSWHASNRGVPVARALVQLAGRSLGIEPVEVYAPVSGHA